MELQVLSLLKYACDIPAAVGHWWCLWSRSMGFGELCVFYLGFWSPDLKGNKFSLFTYPWQSYNILTKRCMPSKTTLFNTYKQRSLAAGSAFIFTLFLQLFFISSPTHSSHSAACDVEYEDKLFPHEFSRWFASSGFEWKPISLVTNEICSGNSWGNPKQKQKISRMLGVTVFFTAF